MNLYLYKPSFYVHIITCIMGLYALLLYFDTKLEPKENLIILLLFTIFLGIHSISHFNLETHYLYNPLYTINKPPIDSSNNTYCTYYRNRNLWITK